MPFLQKSESFYKIAILTKNKDLNLAIFEKEDFKKLRLAICS